MKDRKANDWNPLGFNDAAGSITILAVSVLLVLYDMVGAAGTIGLP